MRDNQQRRWRETVNKMGRKSGNVLFWKPGEESVYGRSDCLCQMLPIRSSKIKTENGPLVEQSDQYFFSVGRRSK